MDRKRICLIAQFPPPVHGLSKAVDTMYHSDLARIFDLEKINMTANRRIVGNLWKIICSRAELYYFTLSQTRGGNLRDLAVLGLLGLMRKSCIAHLHGGYYRQLVDHCVPDWQRRANYRAVGRLQGVIVLGQSLVSQFDGMTASDRIHVVPNCVDDEYLMSEEEFQQKINSLADRRVKHILYLSHFIRSKGYPRVLELARLEKERYKEGGERKFHFDFAGEFLGKEERNYFHDYIRQNKIEDFVTYHGVVAGCGKKRLLMESDVLALLSRYPREGQPICILEAMGNGSVILTTDHAGIPDIVNAENGIIADKTATVEMLYSTLVSMSTEDFRAKEIKGREKILKEYRQDIYIERLKKLLGGGKNIIHPHISVTGGWQEGRVYLYG